MFLLLDFWLTPQVLAYVLQMKELYLSPTHTLSLNYLITFRIEDNVWDWKSTYPISTWMWVWSGQQLKGTVDLRIDYIRFWLRTTARNGPNSHHANLPSMVNCSRVHTRTDIAMKIWQCEVCYNTSSWQRFLSSCKRFWVMTDTAGCISYKI